MTIWAFTDKGAENDLPIVNLIGCLMMLASVPFGLALLGAGLWTHFSDSRLLLPAACWLIVMGGGELLAFGWPFIRNVCIGIGAYFAIAVPLMALAVYVA